MHSAADREQVFHFAAQRDITGKGIEESLFMIDVKFTVHECIKRFFRSQRKQRMHGSL